MTPLGNQDLETLARTIWGAARCDGKKAMQGIAEVILNRLEDERWPGSVREICMDAARFPFWHAATPERGRVLLANLHDGSFRVAYRAALDALEGANITNGATDFDVAFQRRCREPAAVPTVEIGRYRFLRV
jgi:spore germination cell wall hydrolase CwlJ-like protein